MNLGIIVYFILIFKGGPRRYKRHVKDLMVFYELNFFFAKKLLFFFIRCFLGWGIEALNKY